MPIIITKFDWSQTENKLIIKVPLYGVHHSKVDVFYSLRYLKASFEQYFFELILLHPIAPQSSSCTFTCNQIVLELAKAEPLIWDTLQPNISKLEKQQLKMKYIEEEHQRIQAESAQNVNKKAEMKRLAVREQIAIDTQQREKIESIKSNEKTQALEEMNIWKDSKTKKLEKRKSKSRKDKTVEQLPPLPPSPPPPRASKTVNVAFTPREFPTPCRESRMDEEDEWLRKQAAARRSVGFISEDLRPEEHNPLFLKHKGDQFLRGRNFLGAISAYSFGIKLNENFADLYVGRAEAHLAQGNFNKCVQDCSKALELMKPEVQQNLRERALCIGWRGIGLLHLGLIQQGIDELKASLRLAPNENFSIKLEEAMDSLEIN